MSSGLSRIRLLLTFVLLLVSAFVMQGVVFGQTPVATPSPQPIATPNIFEAVRRAEDEARRRANLGAAAADLRLGRVDRARLKRLIDLQIEALYRESNREEKKLLRPRENLANSQKDVLKLPDTGLVKLIKDEGCSDRTSVVVASEHCLKFSMPGSGSSFSFRTKSHRISRLSDISFSNGMFQTLGYLVRGILVDIGDVPLANVSLRSRGAAYLSGYPLTSDITEAIKADREFAAGVLSDGFSYSRTLPAKMNTTYLLRSAAYNGTAYKAVEGFAYDEFEFDQRRDVIVAFRVVGEDADGITIVYRELQDKRSPSIKSPQRSDGLTDNKFTADVSY